MSKTEVPEFIKDSAKFGINLGLERMNELDRLLGNPEKNLKVVHIAGTNGKGSTVTFISTCLAEAGYRVGIYTSPFLERFSERLRIIDGKEGLNRLLKDETEGEISDEDLNRLSARVEEACNEMTSDGFEHPTEFELMTALGYLWFREQETDIVVLETGLGGRLDSTNVFDEPLATIITSIGFDHQDRLGNTIEQITSEKAGIFKKGVPAFSSEPSQMLIERGEQEKIRQTLLKCASEKETAGLVFVNADPGSAVFTEDGKMVFEACGRKYETRLQGRHQVLNAALAVRVLQDVFGLEDDVIAAGISKARWKGRAELLCNDPAVILDGGHNVQCAESLMTALKEMCAGRFGDMRFRVVMGVMADKNVQGMIETYRDMGLDPAEVYAVRVNNPRSMSPDDLSLLIRIVYNNSIMPVSCDSAEEAVSEACRKTREDGIPLLVTGSLYLIGEVRGKLCTITDNWR
jgi:dihydrofolate synthase/folylpolyglutamate synthase